MAKAIPPDILYKFFPSKREDFFDMPALRFTPIRELNDPFESNLSLGNKIIPRKPYFIFICLTSRTLYSLSSTFLHSSRYRSFLTISLSPAGPKA